MYRYSIKENKKYLIYVEQDSHYSLEGMCEYFDEIIVEQSKSGEYIFLQVDSDFQPTTSEVWFKSSQGNTNFALYKPMRYGVSYSLQQAGDYFYVLTNQDKPYHYLQKAKIPDEFLYKHPGSKAITGEKKFVLPMVKDMEIKLTLNEQPIKESEIEQQIKNRQTPSTSFISRSHNIEAYHASLLSDPGFKSVINKPDILGDVLGEDYKNDPVLDFDVFKHYLLTVVGDNANPKVVVKSLLKNTEHRVILPEAPLILSLEPNMRYSNNVGLFSCAYLNHPESYNEYNMSLQRLASKPFVSYEGLDTSNYKTEKIQIKTQDKFDIPANLIYHKDLVHGNSPAIMFTNGTNFSLDSMSFKFWFAPLLERGCTIVFPEIRGTNIRDSSWLEKGILEKKIIHIRDFAEVARYIKTNKISQRIAAIGETKSGALTVSSCMLKEPELFDAVVLNV